MGLPLILLWLAISAPNVTDPMQPVRMALQERNLDAALQHLESLQTDHPHLYHWNQLPYLEGVLLQRKGQIQAARTVLEKLANSESALADYALLHLIELTANAPVAARQEYAERFLNRFPNHPKWASTALSLGRDLRQEGRLDAAKIWLDQVWRRGTGSLSRQAALEHALIHLDRKENAEAIKDLQRLLAKSERDDVAQLAARKLHQIQPISELSEGELRRRARVFVNNRDGATAREYLESAMQRFPRSLSADQYAYLNGRTYVIENRFRTAQEAYQKAYRQFPTSSWGVYSLYQTGNLALRLLDYEGAERFYRSVVEKHPASRYAPRAWFNLADTYLWLGQAAAARQTLQAALQKTPRRERDQFRYALARLDLDDGDYGAALSQLESLDHLASTRLPSGVTREEIHFWKGVALDALGRHSDALEAFEVAAEGSPNYFAFQARNRLPEGVREISADRDDIWLQRLLPPRDWRSEPPPTPTARGRIQDLLFLQLFDEAALEIRQAGPAVFGGDSISHLFNLAYYADQGLLPETSILAAERLQTAAFGRKDPSAYPPIVQSLLYPRHYWSFVSQYSGQNQIEPELTLSIIRQESRFQSDAKSIAAARGLMQFMRATARELAKELSIESPSEADLYQPELSVRLGTHYLRKLLNRFDGSVEKALAAYNGGPDNVERWAAKLKHADSERFVANIGFRETKLYVLKVMGNYFIYKSLSPGRQPEESSVAGGER